MYTYKALIQSSLQKLLKFEIEKSIKKEKKCFFLVYEKILKFY